MLQRHAARPDDAHAIGYRLAFAATMLTSLTGCGFFSSPGEGLLTAPLPMTAELRLDPTVTGAGLSYKDACGQAQTLPIGDSLKDIAIRRIGKIFEQVPTGQKVSPPDGYVDVALGLKYAELVIPRKRTQSYPAAVSLGLDFSYTDQNGTTLFDKKLQSTARGDIDIDENSCEVKGLEKIAKEAAEIVVEGMAKQLRASPKIREAAQAPRTNPRPATVSPSPAPPLAAASPAVPISPPTQVVAALQPVEEAKLSFRAIIRDENRNQVLENQEPVTIDIEVKNEGPGGAQGVEVLVSGSPLLSQQFPGSVAIGDLRPGEFKRVTTSARLVSVKEVEQAELVLTLRASSQSAQLPPSKKFLVAIKPDRSEEVHVLSVDVDQIPKSPAGFKQAKAIGIVMGIGRFRDTTAPAVKFAARDAKIVAQYLTTVGGIPGNRVRLMLDGQALKDDLAEVFEDWLPKHSETGSTVIIYFSGRVQIDAASGAASLVPYDGTMSTPNRLFSIRRLQDALARAHIKQAVLLLEISLEPSPGADPSRSAVPIWEGDERGDGKSKLMWIIGNERLQEAHAYEQGQHGLFTYYLLKGIRGGADADHDGIVQAGELCTFVRDQVQTTAKAQFGNQQEPVCISGPGQNSPMRILPLTRVK